jgi:hypothetical protein
VIALINEFLEKEIGMSDGSENKDVWQYGTYEGAEKLRMQQERKLSFSQKLDLLDEMIDFTTSIHGSQMLVREDSPGYGTFAKKEKSDDSR